MSSIIERNAAVQIDPAYDPTAEQWAAYDAGEPYVPTLDDLAELAEIRDCSRAETYLSRPGLPLAAQIEHVAAFFAGCDTSAMALMGRHLAELAAAVRSTRATTVEEHEARDEVLRQDRLYELMDAAYETGRDMQ